MTRRPRLRPGEGITGTAAAERAPIAIAARAHLDPRFKLFPNLPEDEYESILAVPILARQKLEGALNVRTRAPREHSQAEIDLLVAIASQVAQSIQHARLYADAQRRVHELEALARISEAVSESLYLEESLEAIVKTTIAAVDATGAALVLEDGEIAWPEGRAGAYNVRLPLRWKRRQIGELVCDRDTPFSDEDRRCSRRSPTTPRSRSSTAARSCAACSPRRSTTGSRTTCRPVASLLRLQARRAEVDPRRALTDSVNRILAIAAVHEVLTEHREDDVDLAELIERLRAMLVQGLVAGEDGRGRARAGLARRRPGDRARTRLQRALPERARARRRHGPDRARAPRRRRRARGRRRRRRPERRRRRHRPLDRARARARGAAGHDRADERARPARRGAVLPGMRMLIAEDETIIRMDLRSLLEGGRLRGLRGGARRRGGGRAGADGAARPRRARREDAAARRDRGARSGSSRSARSRS